MTVEINNLNLFFKYLLVSGKVHHKTMYLNSSNLSVKNQEKRSSEYSAHDIHCIISGSCALLNKKKSTSYNLNNCF